jgi:OPT family oligopeptide transporter
MAIGGVLCLSNLYVTLKTGWSLGVTLTSCIIAFGLFRALGAIGLVRKDLSVLENNAIGSVASAAAFMTGGGNMAALPALLLLTGARPAGVAMFLWFATIAALGVFAAIPIKRQIINIEQLPFPSAVATAETIRAMHGDAKAGGAARKLFSAALVAGLVTVLRDLRALPFHLPGRFGLPFRLGGHAAADWSLALDGSLVLLGGGALMSMRTAWSLLLGALVTYGLVAPAMVARGVIATVDYKTIVTFTLWPGAALLVASGVLSFAFQWRSAARSLAGLLDVLRRRPAIHDDPLADIEAPRWWFPAGFAVLSPIIIFLMARLFGVPWWAGVMAIPLALAMGVVAARVTGETDVTPTKALGPVTQLIYGIALPANVTANVMSANVTGGVGLHAADLLTDLKSGYLLGANPRQQVRAQLFGVAIGAAVVVPAFALLVPSAAALGTPEFPAPAVLVWASVSKALAGGIGGLPHAARVGIAIGAGVGAVLATLEKLLPKRALRFVPSPAGLGIAMVMPGSNAIAMFSGAAIAALLRRHRPSFATASLTPIASGLIAGESLTGITIALLRAAGLGV